jgi:hypothetical protein
VAELGSLCTFLYVELVLKWILIISNLGDEALFCKISNLGSTMLGTTSDDVEWGMKGGLQCID